MKTILERLKKLTELSIDEIEALHADAFAAYETNRNGGTDGNVNVDDAHVLADAIKKINARKAELAVEAEAALAELAALDAAVGFGTEGGEPEPEGEGDAPEGDAPVEGDAPAEGDTPAEGDAPVEGDAPEGDAPVEGDAPEELAAPAAPARVLRMPLRQTQAVSAPAPEAREKELLFDSNGNSRKIEDFGQMFNQGINRVPKTAQGVGVRSHIATLKFDSDVIPVVGKFEDFATADEAFQKLVDEKNQEFDQFATLKASGGPCVARRQEFALGVIGGDSEPVDAALPSVQSNGGGTSFYQSFEAFGAMDGVTATYSAADDIEGAGTIQAPGPYPKTEGALACPSPINCDKTLVVENVKIGNWVDMSWPEYVAAAKKIADVYLAQTAEERRLKAIYDYATAQTNVFNETAQPLGATQQLVDVILRYVTVDRKAQRVKKDVRYNVFLEEGTEEALVVDLARKMNTSGTMMTVDNAVFEILRKYNIAVSFYNSKDQFGTPAGIAGARAGNLIGTGGTLPKWDAKTRIAIMRDDAVYNDKGPQLDLGVFRTQEDFETNNYHLFFEFLEATCFRNKHVFIVDTLLCPTGTQSGTTTAPTCS